MRRILVLITLGLSVLAIATYFGVAMAQKAVAEDPLDAWKYPEATPLGSGEGAGAHYMVLVTTDPLDKVLTFYGKKVGEKLSADRPGGMGVHGGDGQATVFQDDSIQPGAKSEPRPVVVRIFVRRAKDHDVTLVITHAKDEAQTHISLTYFTK